jgi:hypothetical protein
LAVRRNPGTFRAFKSSLEQGPTLLHWASKMANPNPFKRPRGLKSGAADEQREQQRETTLLLSTIAVLLAAWVFIVWVLRISHPEILVALRGLWPS